MNKREFKFRGWNTLEKKWSIPYLDDWFITKGDNKPSIRLGAKDVEIISEFTGLQDKNGIDIYDGDIVKGNQSEFNEETLEWEDEETEVSHIWYNDNSATWVASQNHPYSETSFVFTSYNLFNIEIIGNIFENPELL